MAVLMSYPSAVAIHRGFLGQVNRHAPAICYLQRATTGQTEIAPVCLMYTWFLVEPSYRVGVALYAWVLGVVGR